MKTGSWIRLDESNSAHKVSELLKVTFQLCSTFIVGHTNINHIWWLSGHDSHHPSKIVSHLYEKETEVQNDDLTYKTCSIILENPNMRTEDSRLPTLSHDLNHDTFLTSKKIRIQIQNVTNILNTIPSPYILHKPLGFLDSIQSLKPYINH